MSAPLPDYTADQFALRDPPECDLILKGGITSGIVYPYAILELATKYRFRSLGGTSAGAIAAAFAAAAEYSRSVRRDPAGFVRLKSWCDRLPDDLLSLFQPDHELAAATDLGLRALKAKGWRPLVRDLLPTAALWGGTAGLILGGVICLASGQLLAGILAFLLGGLLGTAAGAWRSANRTILKPLRQVFADLPDRMFGFCSGLTVDGAKSPGLTDWLHDALQDIAFGPDGSSEVLTFGHLEKVGRSRAPIELRMVTTNLSMMRPHTLPAFGMQAGYDPDEWRALFPGAILEHLEGRSKPWKGLRTLPFGEDMPVLVATRMSLSFPLLFRAIPVHAEDYEAFRIARALGGEQKALSDIAGWDIQVHGGDFQKAVRRVRDWLVDKAGADPIGAARIQGKYIAFQEWHYERELSAGASDDDIKEYPTNLILTAMHEWMAAGQPV